MLFLIMLLLFTVIQLFLTMIMLLSVFFHGRLATLGFLIMCGMILYYTFLVILTVQLACLHRMHPHMLLCMEVLLVFVMIFLIERIILMRNKFAMVSEPHSFLSCIGEREHKLYASRFDGSRVVLEESGSFDIQERINSFAPYTDIAYMLNRLKVGDNSVLSTRHPMYGDFSGMPDNPTDAINLYHNAENAFSQLSAEERLRFNNDFRVWLASIMSGNITVPDNKLDTKPVVNPDAKPDINPVVNPDIKPDTKE